MTEQSTPNQSFERPSSVEVKPASAEGTPEETQTIASLATRSDSQGKAARTQQKVGVAVIAGVTGLGLVFFVMAILNVGSQPEHPKAATLATPSASPQAKPDNQSANEGKSSVPILATDQQQIAGASNPGLTPDEIGGTAKRTNESSSNGSGTLGSIPSFGNNDGWQPTPYQSSSAVAVPDDTVLSGERSDKDLDKSSLVFTHTTASGSGNNQNQLESGVGLLPGNRLRAHLEAMVTTAVAMPVIAVIDYSYTRNGEILVPAGAKAVGEIEQADRSGYISICFESLLMPDGTRVPISGLATNLRLGPLKGNVAGSHRGKNILVRSLTGIGEMGSLLIGQGNVNQPVSQADLLRQQVASNMGGATDEQIAKAAVSENIVVSVPANTGIYITLQQAAKTRTQGSKKTPAQSNAEELRQLLNLQRELKQSPSNSPQS